MWPGWPGPAHFCWWRVPSQPTALDSQGCASTHIPQHAPPPGVPMWVRVLWAPSSSSNYRFTKVRPWPAKGWNNWVLDQKFDALTNWAIAEWQGKDQILGYLSRSVGSNPVRDKKIFFLLFHTKKCVWHCLCDIPIVVW